MLAERGMLLRSDEIESEANRPRVFCVGWHKTGTSTLGLALIELGYKVLGCRLDTVEDLKAGRIESVLAIADDFDALQDVPWAFLFKELDQRYPGSRFILTDRDEAAWLKSAQGHFASGNYPMHEVMYGEGRLEGNENLYLTRFRAHNAAVRSYFRDRPGDFMEMNLSAGDGWEQLCAFLGKPVPGRPFPHANKGPHSLSTAERWRNRARDIAPVVLRRGWFRVRLAVRDIFGLPDPRNRFHNLEANRRNRRSR